MFKIGIISDWLNMPFKEAMQTCHKLQANGVQMYAVEGEMSPENITPSALKEKKRILKENGLEVSALCGDLGGHGFAIKEDNEAKIEKSKRIIELAKHFDSNVVTTHIGVIPNDENSNRYKIMLEACNKLAEIASKNDAYFAIETGPEKAEHLKAFLDKIDTKGIAVNLDPANLVMVADDDPVKAVYTLKDYIVHTHAKDGIMIKKTDPQLIYDFFADGGIGDLRLGDYFAETPFGEGGVDFDRYLAALRDIGYTGYLTVERELGNDPINNITLAVNYLKNKIRGAL